MPENETPIEQPKPPEQVANELVSKFLSSSDFAITKEGEKIYVNIFDYTQFWLVCCKSNSIKPKLPWPPNVELRHVKGGDK